MTLTELVVDVHRRLEAGGIPHAIGGALALDYYIDPRGTLDADLNVFVPLVEAEMVIRLLGTAGLQPEQSPDQWTPIAGVRLAGVEDPTKLDLFFALDERYSEIADRCRVVPFGPDAIPVPILSAEDLAMFKLSFGRPKDWVDLIALARSRPDLDVEMIEDLLIHLRGPTFYPQLARFRALLRDEAQPRM